MIVKYWLKAFALLFVLALVAAAPAMAQKNDEVGDVGQPVDILQQLPGANWTEGPATVKIGNQAQMQIPEGFVYTDGPGTRYMMEVTENLPSNREVGFIAPRSFDWFITFEWEDTGYVEDDDKVDARALMKAMKEGNVEENKRRRAAGWPELNMVGWYKEPYYDERTNNFQWAVELESHGQVSINHNIRLLGREGVMEVTVVAGPNDFDRVVDFSQQLLSTYSYVPGKTYAEYRRGDRTAGYGLAALALGGAAAVVAKAGGGKFLKVLILPILAVVALIGKFFRKLFGIKPKGGDSAGSAE